MTEDEFNAVANHLNECIDAARNARNTFANIAYVDCDNYIEGQRAYWQSVLKGLRWSLALARQKRGVVHDGRNPSLQ